MKRFSCNMFYVEPRTPDQDPILERELDLWDRANPRAVLNLVSADFQSAFTAALKKEPELFGIDERDLFKALRNSNRTPSPTDNRLRLSFWYEYDQSQLQARRMKMGQVYGGICTQVFFNQRLLASPSKLAWLLTPITDYVIKTSEALDFGLDRMRDILEREPINSKGQFDVRLAELQAKITWMLEQRVKGAVIQKVEQKNIGLNIHTTDKQVAGMMMENSMEAMTKRLKELDRIERKLMSLPSVDRKPETVVVESDLDGS